MENEFDHLIHKSKEANSLENAMHKEIGYHFDAISQGRTTDGLSHFSPELTTGGLPDLVLELKMEGYSHLGPEHIHTSLYEDRKLWLATSQQKAFKFIQYSLIITIVVTIVAIFSAIIAWLQFNEPLKTSKESINNWVWIISIIVVCALMIYTFAVLKDYTRRKIRSNYS